MNRFFRMIFVGLFVFLHAGSRLSASAQELLPRGAPNGLYPLWETPGYVLSHRQIVLGTSHAQFGILDRLHLGVSPVEMLYRVPNGHLKVSLYKNPSIHVALQLGVFAILAGADESFFSSNYTSRLANPDHPLFAIPLSVATSWPIAPWLNLHNTLTLLTVLAEAPIQNDVTVGDFVSAELVAARHHSFFLHAGEIGFWEHDLAVLGVSYRLLVGWFEARVGYFMRFSAEGMQSNPSLSLAAIF